MNELLEQASEQPVLLTQYGRAVAVLSGPEPYNRVLEQLEDLRLALNAVEARAEEAPVTDFEEYLEEHGEHGPAERMIWERVREALLQLRGQLSPRL